MLTSENLHYKVRTHLLKDYIFCLKGVRTKDDSKLCKQADKMACSVSKSHELSCFEMSAYLIF